MESPQKILSNSETIKILYILALPIAILFTLTSPALIYSDDPGVKASNELLSNAPLAIIIILVLISTFAKALKLAISTSDLKAIETLARKLNITLIASKVAPLFFIGFSILLEVIL